MSSYKSFDHARQRHSADLDTVHDMVARSLFSHTLSLVCDNTSLDARIWSHGIGICENISIHDLAYGAAVDIVPEGLEAFCVVMMPLAGRARMRYGRREAFIGPGLASVPGARHCLRMRWSRDCAQRIVRIERSVLRAHLHAMLGYPGPEEAELDQLDWDVSRGRGMLFAIHVSNMVAALDHEDGAFDHPSMAAAAEEVLLTQLLLSVPHKFSDALTADEPRVPSRAVRDAADIVKSDPGGTHTVASLARAVNVGRRSLERQFRETMGVSPGKYIKSARLELAHDMLYAADPGHASVGNIAHQVGMTHSHFTAAYQRKFGESPQETLRR